MGKTPGKWIKTLLLGKKSPKSNSENRSKKLGSAKKEELVVSMTEDFSNLTGDPPVVTSQLVPASTAHNVVSPNNGGEQKDNLESRNDLEELELANAAIKVQSAFRAHKARRAFRTTLKGVIRLQAVIRGHLVRRQAIATYSCIWGIVKFQALVRGKKVRSSDNGIQYQKTHMEAGDSEALKLGTYSWMDNPTKFVIVDKLLATSPTAMPLKIQYGPEEPNSAKVWLERWTQLQVWSSGSRAAKIEVPKSQSKKRNYQAVVETEKARPKRGIKKPSVPKSGTASSRATTDKPKRNVRKASTLSKDPLRNESDKANHNLRKSRRASKEGSPLENKDEKPIPRLKDEKPIPSLKRSSLSNGPKKAILKSAEKKKDTADSVQIEPEGNVSGKVLDGGEKIEFVEKEKDTADSVQIEPEGNVSGKILEGDKIEFAGNEKDTADSVQMEPEGNVSGKVLEGRDKTEFAGNEKDIADSVQMEPEENVSGKVREGRDKIEFTGNEKDTADSVQMEPEENVSGKVLEGGDKIEFAEKEKDTLDAVPIEFDVIKDEKSPVLDGPEENEPKTAETCVKGEDPKCSDVKVSSENGNVGSDNTKPSERRALLPANVDNQDDGLSHSGRKIPSYMAPTASAKARIKGEGSPRFSQEKTEINGALRRHSLPSPANGKLSTTTISPTPKAHKLLLASAKGSMNGDKSLTSSKDINHKSTRTEWKR